MDGGRHLSLTEFHAELDRLTAELGAMCATAATTMDFAPRRWCNPMSRLLDASSTNSRASMGSTVEFAIARTQCSRCKHPSPATYGWWSPRSRSLLPRIGWVGSRQTSRRSPDDTIRVCACRHRRPVFAVGILLLIVNGLSPYLGLKTESTFTMFSNLRTEGGNWNHLFIPASVGVFGYQDQLVRITGSNDPALQDRTRDGTRLVRFELDRYLSVASRHQRHLRRGDIRRRDVNDHNLARARTLLDVDPEEGRQVQGRAAAATGWMLTGVGQASVAVVDPVGDGDVRAFRPSDVWSAVRSLGVGVTPCRCAS